MKFSTKLKILRWVEKILKCEFAGIDIPIRKEMRKIITIQWTGHLYEWDANNNLTEIACHEIAKELAKLNLIKIEKEEDRESGFNISAKAFLVVTTECFPMRPVEAL